MKKLLYLTFLFVIIAASSFVTYTKRDNYASLYNALDPCKKPVVYRVDEVDKRFNLSRDKVIDYAKEAADIWNVSSGRELFVYSEMGDLSLNMVFDERQQASNKISALDRNVESEKDKLNAMIAKHQTDVVDFKKRLALHNATVQSWNAQGGAPSDEYDKLIAEQKALEGEARSLNEQARSLNIATEDYNLQVGNLNEAIAGFNVDLEKKPEEGLFIGEENKIEIYFNNNREELVHTIAHELGHARDLDHNNNAKSIMYPFSTRVVTASADDIRDLAEVCRKRSPVEVVRTRLRL